MFMVVVGEAFNRGICVRACVFSLVIAKALFGICYYSDRGIQNRIIYIYIYKCHKKEVKIYEGILVRPCFTRGILDIFS